MPDQRPILYAVKDVHRLSRDTSRKKSRNRTWPGITDTYFHFRNKRNNLLQLVTGRLSHSTRRNTWLKHTNYCRLVWPLKWNIRHRQTPEYQYFLKILPLINYSARWDLSIFRYSSKTSGHRSLEGLTPLNIWWAKTLSYIIFALTSLPSICKNIN